MSTVGDIVTDAMRELRIVAMGQDLSAEDAAAGLRAYNRMVAGWAAQGVSFTYPTDATVWRGEWRRSTTYSVGHGVRVGGKGYVCIIDHTSTADNEPGSSVTAAVYWTPDAYIALAMASTFPLLVEFEEPVVALLAQRLGQQYGIPLTVELKQRAYDGWAQICGRYMRVPEARLDLALVQWLDTETDRPISATPTATPSGGTYSVAQYITLETSTSGGVIYYTTDGTAPTTSSTRYTGPFLFTGTGTVQAITVTPDYRNSAVMAESYTILDPTGDLFVLEEGGSALLTETAEYLLLE